MNGNLLWISLVFIAFVAGHDALVGTESGSPPSLQTLQFYTMYSYAASCRQGLLNWTCFWCNHLSNLPAVKVAAVLESNGIYGTYGYIGNTADSIIISFRGSESLENWLHDFDFLLTNYPGVSGVEIHEGFWSAYLQVKDTIFKNVIALKKKNPKFKITLAGHSLGAALSALCGFDLVNASLIEPENISVINLGQPRTGNDKWAEAFNKAIKTSYRLVNHRDIVPHLPPQIFSYHHVATEIWFSSSYTKFTVCNGSGEDPNCSDSLDFWNPIDHLHYLGYFSHDPNAIKANCGPLPHLNHKKN